MGDLKNAHLDKLSPTLAKHVLPKMYKQLQNSTLRLNRYKQQCIYYRKKVIQLKNLLLDLCTHHGIPVPKRVWARNRTLQISEMPPPVESEDDDNTEQKVKEELPEPVELSSEEEDDNEEDDSDKYCVRLEDQAVEKLMSVL